MSSFFFGTSILGSSSFASRDSNGGPEQARDSLIVLFSSPCSARTAEAGGFAGITTVLFKMLSSFCPSAADSGQTANLGSSSLASRAANGGPEQARDSSPRILGSSLEWRNGIRVGLKNRYPHGCVGSSPTSSIVFPSFSVSRRQCCSEPPINPGGEELVKLFHNAVSE